MNCSRINDDNTSCENEQQDIHTCPFDNSECTCCSKHTEECFQNS